MSASASDRPTGTVAFLFTDIEGSTRRWDHLPAAMAGALRRHDALLRDAVEGHDGHVFKTVGDAFCAAFPRAEAALAAALAAQRVLAAEDWGEAGPVLVRMALHAGATEERDGDYFGPAVNRVARLLAAGHGGQVLLSRAAEQLVRDALPAGVGLRDLGEHRLKDLERPERIFQAAAPDMPAEFPALVTLDRQAHNLPVQLTPFLGREGEVARLVELLRRPDVRLVTLTGPGGTGKTRVALQLAADLLDDYPGGAWFVELEEATDEDAVVAASAAALGVREAAGLPPRDALVEFLRPKALLLVLDNFEQVAHAAPLIGALLRAAPGVMALVTSRVRLGIRGEHAYAVPPLGVPPKEARRADPEELGRYEAVRLFAERARAAKGAFALTADNAAAVAAICRELDGLPLAIELAAARVRLLPPPALLRRLEDRLGLLVGGARDASARQQTLRGAIAWSHDLLPPAERTLFARLSVFAGGFDLEAAEPVANPGQELDLFGALGALVDHSLVRQEETAGGEARFAMLATIREFAREALEQAGGGEAELTRMLHAEHFLALAERAATHLDSPEQTAWLERMETEHDNLRAALGFFAAFGPADGLLRLAASLWKFWDAHGHLTEGRSWLDRALAADGADSAEVHAEALHGAGVLAARQGDAAPAQALHEEALAIRRASGDQRGIARSLANLGMLAEERKEFDEATTLHEEALALWRDLEDEQGIAGSLHDLAMVAVAQGNRPEAERRIVESAAIWRRLGDDYGIAIALGTLGQLALLEGNYPRAVDHHTEGLAMWRALGDETEIARALGNLGEALQCRGILDQAEPLHNEALIRFEQQGNMRGMAEVLGYLGDLARQRGDHDQVAHLVARCLELASAIGDDYLVAAGLEQMAGAAQARGHTAEAVRLAGAATALRGSAGSPTDAPHQRAGRERLVAALRAEIGDDRFAEAWAAGQQMPVDGAIVLARELGRRAASA